MFSKKAKMILFHLLLILAVGINIDAQTDAQLGEATIKGVQLFEQKRFVEAIPHFELLVKAIPENPKLRFLYGFCLVAQSKQTDDAELAKQSSAKALEQFKTAKQLGYKDEMNDALIKLLSGETSAEESNYSKNAEANKLVNQGESYFAQSKYDESIKAFQKALELDPNIYQAALSLGDCYAVKKDWINAENAYQKAITIDPTRETAYRYSATPFMKQKKYDEARDRYIEAWITEPYSRMSPNGISQWAEVTGAKLGHPKVDIPEIKYDSNGQLIIAAPVDLPDGSGSGVGIMKRPVYNPDYNSEWKAYVATRVFWKKEKFAKTFPNEKQYRHSLQEEIEAIRDVLKSVKQEKIANAQFEVLQKLDNEGLLESYILMAQADEGIAEDHEAYLKANRPKLRQYVLNYVIQK